jgi:perosamine synthetase
MTMIPVNRPLITKNDIDEVTNALEQTWISGDTNPVKSLEIQLGKYLGISEAIAVSNGSVALDLAVEALEIVAGEKCVVPTFTIISSLANLVRKKAEIQLVDADPVTWSMNANIAATMINEKTKVVVPVHIYGLSTDMDPIIQASSSYGTLILEDAAEALGVNYKGRPCGSLGTVGTLSFFANKIITGGEGGAILTDDLSIAKKIRGLRNLSHSESERFVHYELGWNARLAGLPAALINAQLKRIDQILDNKVRKAKLYLDGLRNHPWFDFQPERTDYSENAYWVFGVVLNQSAPYSAKEFQSQLRLEGIDSRRFFCPMHLQPVFKGLFDNQQGSFPVSERLWNRGLYLPSGLGNTDDEIFKVIETLWKLVK